MSIVKQLRNHQQVSAPLPVASAPDRSRVGARSRCAIGRKSRHARSCASFEPAHDKTFHRGRRVHPGALYTISTDEGMIIAREEYRHPRAALRERLTKWRSVQSANEKHEDTYFGCESAVLRIGAVDPAAGSRAHARASCQAATRKRARQCGDAAR